MIICNHKPIRIIGYHESAMCMEFFNHISQTHLVEVISPEQFSNLDDPHQYQYIVSVSKITNRKNTVAMVDAAQVDLITFIHDTAVVGVCPPPKIEPGSFVFNFATVGLGARVGRHCIIGSYSSIGHFSELGNNCMLCPGVMVNGKSSLGDNCMLNTDVTVTNRAKITSDVELLAFTKVAKNIDQPGMYIGSTPKRVTTVPSPNEL